MRHSTVAGLVLLGLLTLVATLGPSIAPYGVDEREPMRYTVDESGKRVPDLPPYPPSARHLFGPILPDTICSPACFTAPGIRSAS